MAAAAAVVFKTVVDPFVGKLSYVKVVSGKVSADTPLVNMRTGTQERIGKVLTVKGKKQVETDYIGSRRHRCYSKTCVCKNGRHTLLTAQKSSA